MLPQDRVDIPDDEKLIMTSSHLELSLYGEKKSGFVETLRRNGKLFAVKPVAILYGLSFAVTGAVTNQLWIDRVCNVNLGFNKSICNNLTDPIYEDIENAVQQEVSKFNIAGSYIENVPNIIFALYLGPWTDRGRRLMMLLPFLGHLLSGVFYFVFLYYENWPAQLLWVTNVYVFFGGYTVLQIAMYGYIGDVTNAKERTTIMAVLSGLGFIMFPLAEFASGQIYRTGGYYAVYATSLAACVVGIFYIPFIPETILKSSVSQSDEESGDSGNCGQKLLKVIHSGNLMLVKAMKCFFKTRPNNVQRFVYVLVIIMLLSGLSRPWNSILLYTEKQFGWSLVDYTNYTSFGVGIYVVRMFITTPILCYFLGMHDCMLAITGGLAAVAMDVTLGLATKGWMMYYGSAVTIFAGLQQTPLTSIISKCVDPQEFGQVLSVSMVFTGIANLVTSSLMQLIYAYTVAIYPGAVFFISAGFEMIALLAMSILYIFIYKHEKVFGPLGSHQNN